MNTRSVPYTDKERMLLAQLVKENCVVESKMTNGATLAEKNKAWDVLAQVFNAQPEANVKRSAGQLRKLWANLKQRKRKETTALRHTMLVTGGGPPKKPLLDPVLEMVEDAAPHLDVSIICPWDSTAIFEDVNTSTTTEPVSVKLPVTVNDKGSISQPLDLPCCSKSGDFIPSLAVSAPTAKALECLQADIAVAVTDEEDCEELFPSSFSASTDTVRDSLPMKSKNEVSVVGKKDARKEVKQLPSFTYSQELHNLKIQIGKEQLLKIVEGRKSEGEIARIYTRKAENELEKSLIEKETALLHQQRARDEAQRARDEAQRARDEAELASLKLKKFKNLISSEET